MLAALARPATVLLLLASTQNAFAGELRGRDKKSDSDHHYVDSFSRSELGRAALEIEPAAETGASGESGEPSVIAPLAEQTSLPLRLRLGSPEEELNTNDAPAWAFSPPRPAKTYRVKDCTFQVKTGRFSVQAFSFSPGGTLQISDDRLLPHGTVQADETGRIHLSAYTLLEAHFDDEYRAGCRRLLRGRTLRLGAASLEGSKLEAALDTGASHPGTKAQAISPLDVYVTWDPGFHGLVIVDRNGLIPILETDVVAIEAPGQDRDFYLRLEPMLTIKTKLRPK